MELTLTPAQEALQRQAREFLDRECPRSVVRSAEASELGYDVGLWRQMAELGWLGFGLPDAYGGANAGVVDLALLYEELGRALAPGPYLTSSILAARIILAAGSDEQKTYVLPRIADGSMILAVAQVEPSLDRTPAGITTEARRDGEHYVLSGTKLFVAHASVADTLIVACRTSPATANKPGAGISLFLVGRDTPGLQIRPMRSIANDRAAEVVLDQVRVPANWILGEHGAGWTALEAANEVAAVLRCAEMVGGMQAVLDMSVEYAKQRVQFGRPIGAFQAIQHKAVVMVMETTGSRLITYQTAWKLEQNLAKPIDISLAKAKCSDAYRTVTFEGHEIHGAIGWTKEYDLQLYFRRRTSDELSFGGRGEHLAIIAGAVTDGALPVPHR